MNVREDESVIYLQNVTDVAVVVDQLENEARRKCFQLFSDGLVALRDAIKLNLLLGLDEQKRL